MQGFTYDELVAALQSWPEDDASEYVAEIPRLIALGELRLVRDLNLELFDVTRDDITVTGNDRLVPKPAGTITTRKMGVIVNGRYFPVLLRTRDWCDMYAPDPNVLDRPLYYCEYDEENWYFVNTPDQNMTAKAVLVIRPAGLSEANPNTWLGDHVGDLLFCCCLLEAEQWIKADDRYADLKMKYETELLPNQRAELSNLIRNAGYSPYKPAAQKAG
jgi:hypothetical protein